MLGVTEANLILQIQFIEFLKYPAPWFIKIRSFLEIRRIPLYTILDRRARDTPLKVLILAENFGTVVAAHCDCMAGLCEACSYMGAILFAVEAGVIMRDSSICTQEKSK